MLFVLTRHRCAISACGLSQHEDIQHASQCELFVQFRRPLKGLGRQGPKVLRALIKGGIPPPGPGKGFHGESDDQKTIDNLGTFRGYPGEATPTSRWTFRGHQEKPVSPVGVLGVHFPRLPALLAKRNGGRRVGGQGRAR